MDIKKKLYTPLLKGADSIKKGIILKKNVLYCDWTASGLGFKEVEKRIGLILPYYANTHSESSQHAALMEDLYQCAKEHLKRDLELDDSFALIAIGSGSSGAIKRFQEILGIYASAPLKKRLKSLVGNFPLVILGPYEHHSNEVSFREALCEVVRVPLDKQGLVDLCALEMILKAHKDREIIASFSLASNVTGIIVPYEEISTIVRSYNGVMAFDMASSSAYMNIPCHLFDAAYYSPHKLLGGVGSCGLLAVSKKLVDTSLPPSFAGGGSVSYVSHKKQFYIHDIQKREEAGTPPITQLIRASLAYRLRNEIGLEWIGKYKEKLHQYLLEHIQNIPNICIYGNQKVKNIGTVSFNIAQHSPYDITRILSQKYLIETRAGCSCAGPYGHELLGLKDLPSPPVHKPGWVRVSTHFTHTQDDIQNIINALKEINP